MKENWDIKVVNDFAGYPFIVVDDWYSDSELNNIWKELDFYLAVEKDKIMRAENTTVARRPDGTSKSNAFRFYLDDRYDKHREASPILNAMYKQTSKQFGDSLKECKPYYRSFYSTNFDCSMVSYYENNDHYDAHHDTYLWTNLIWVYKEPRRFEGGDLFLDDIDVEIKVKNNRAVFFPSCYLHRVTPVKMNEGNFNDGYGRFCITHFYGSYPPTMNKDLKFTANKREDTYKAIAKNENK